MNERQARDLLLIRAIEQSDDQEAVLTREDRQWATQAALAQPGAVKQKRSGKNALSVSEESFLARRAALARGQLETRHPHIAHAYIGLGWPRLLAWVLPIIALVAGVSANELAGGQRINLIAFPLLGMLVWNIAVYFFLIVKWATSRADSGQRQAMPEVLTRLMIRLAQPFRNKIPTVEPLARGLAKYSHDWLHFSASLTLNRAHAILHLSAAFFAGGLVAGMYARAFGLEYLAGWESTFIDEYTLHRILNFILAPASALTGIVIPGPASLAALRWSDTQAGENAASWIHLYAVTAFLFIILPRLLLSLWAVLRAAYLSSHFPLPLTADPYLRRLLVVTRGEGNVLKFIPYSYQPSAAAQKNLSELFAQVLGRQSRSEFVAPIAYGQEDEYLEKIMRGEEGTADYLIVLFNLSATPEAENQGALIEGLRAAEKRKAAGHVLVIVDESAYRQRLAGQAGSDTRMAERRLAWEQMLRNHGVRPITLDSEADDFSTYARQLEIVITQDNSTAAPR